MKTKPPPRNQEAMCPECGNQEQFHDYWDECLSCGYGVDGKRPGIRSIALNVLEHEDA